VRGEVLADSGEDADVLQDLLRSSKDVHHDVGRRVLILGTTWGRRKSGAEPAVPDLPLRGRPAVVATGGPALCGWVRAAAVTVK
jgi:hypothetical protein